MLQLTWATDSGLNIADAIHKVVDAHVDGGGEASYWMATFVNAVIAVPVESRGHSFNYNPSGGELFAQCYAHALTLPEYAGAIVV